jgi:hypothetical protein
VERGARHVWLAKISRCTLKACEEFSPHPFVRGLARMNQGLRSLHSLNPWAMPLVPLRSADFAGCCVKYVNAVTQGGVALYCSSFPHLFTAAAKTVGSMSLTHF